MIFKGPKEWRWIWLGLLLIPSAYLSFMWPVFTDEIAWKWISSRLWWDDGYAVTLYPQCSVMGKVKVPALFLPVWALESSLYGLAPAILSLRYLGIFVLVLWGLVLWQLLKTISKLSQSDLRDLLALVASVCLMGGLPFLLVMNRPEQVLLLIATAMVWLPFLHPRDPLRKYGIGSSFVFLGLLFFSQHAKALFFLPLLLLAAWKLRLSKKIRIGVMFSLLVFSAQGYLFFVEHTQCNNHFIKAAFSKMMISPMALATAPAESLRAMVSNVLNFVDYVRNIHVLDTYPQHWLPTNYGFSMGAKFLNVLLDLFFVVWMTASCWGVFRNSVLRRQRDRSTEVSDLSLAMGIGLGGMAVFQSSKTFYDSALVLPLLIMMGSGVVEKRTLKLLSSIALGLATFSVALVCYRFWPNLHQEWRGVGRLVQQEYSVKPAYQKGLERRLIALSEKCGLQNTIGKKHLVMDDLTYPYFMKTQEPYHAVYVLGWWGKMSIENPIEFLKSKGSCGIISQCHWLPEELLSRAVRDDDLCCLPEF